MTPEQEIIIRAKALELAIGALSKDANSAEYVDFAKDFAEYIAGPGPAAAQVFDGSEEPPIGQYTDRDGDEWARTVDGWHWRTSDATHAWEDVREFAPFTKIED